MRKQISSRLETIDVMQGIAMLWVIIGHHLLPFMPKSYGSFHYYIYSFHMPLFIAISGFLIAYSYKQGSYKDYVLKRFKKFFVPYVIVGGFISVLAALSQGWDTLPLNLSYLVVAPLKSEATFLWYIYLLFFLYVLYPWVDRICRANPLLASLGGLAIGWVGYGISWSVEYFCLGYFSKYFLFYFLGVLCGRNFPWIARNMRYLSIGAYVGLALFLLLSVYERMGVASPWLYRGICLASLPAMLALAKLFRLLPLLSKGTVWISVNCFHIYLLHMFFVQAMALCFGKLSGFNLLGNVEAAVYIAISSVVAMLGSVYFFRVFDYIKRRFV